MQLIVIVLIHRNKVGPAFVREQHRGLGLVIRDRMQDDREDSMMKDRQTYNHYEFIRYTYIYIYVSLSLSLYIYIYICNTTPGPGRPR